MEQEKAKGMMQKYKVRECPDRIWDTNIQIEEQYDPGVHCPFVRMPQTHSVVRVTERPRPTEHCSRGTARYQEKKTWFLVSATSESRRPQTRSNPSRASPSLPSSLPRCRSPHACLGASPRSDK